MAAGPRGPPEITEYWPVIRLRCEGWDPAFNSLCFLGYLKVPFSKISPKMSLHSEVPEPDGLEKCCDALKCNELRN